MQFFKGIWKGKPYWQQLLYTLLVMIGMSSVLGSIAFLILEVTAFPGIIKNPSILNDAALTPEVVKGLKLVLLLTTLGFFLFPALMMSYFIGGDTNKYLGLHKRPKLLLLLVIVPLIFIADPFLTYLSEINSLLPIPEGSYFDVKHTDAQDSYRMFLGMDSIYDLLMGLVLMAVLPALGEELLFRGVIQKIFKGWTKNTHAAVWITSFLFAAMHLQIFFILPMILLGALLGYLKEWTGSLWYPVIVHFINNASVVVVTYYIDAPEGQEYNSMLAPVVSVVATTSLLFVIWKLGKKASHSLSA